ncbi:MAG TPA: hypothetical protein VGE22_03410, partial [Solimonas sp.]
HHLRPAEKRHDPWLARVTGQLLAACTLLEEDLARAPLPDPSRHIGDAGITIAVAWDFMQMKVPDRVQAAHHTALASYCAQAERLPAFSAQPSH